MLKDNEKFLKDLNKKLNLEEKKNEIDIKNEAQNFLDTIDRLTGKTLDKEKRNIASEVEASFLKESRQAILYKRAIKKFSKALDTFLERKIILTLVDEEGNILLAGQKTYNELFKNKDFRINFSSIKGKSGFLLSDKYISDFDKYANTYKSALYRYNKTLESTKSQKETFIYWHDDEDKRVYAYVNNRGSIKEGYVNAINEEDTSIQSDSVLDEHKGDQKNENALRILYINHILNVDNAYGIKHGDVNITDKIQLAVKGSGAGFEGRGPLIKIASKIVKAEEDITEEIIYNFMDKLQPNESKLNKILNEEAETALKDAIENKIEFKKEGWSFYKET